MKILQYGQTICEAPLPSLPETIEALIAARGLGPGQRLPAERALAGELGVSRSRLREAMQQLISRGVVVSRQGGGTFVAQNPVESPLAAALSPLEALAGGEAGYWRDVMEIRKALEPEAAFHAALRASGMDKARLEAALNAVSGLDSAGPQQQAEADAAFHLAIAEASHNAVLAQVMAGLLGLMRLSIAESLRQLFRLPRTAERLEEQHRAIFAAICAGEPEAARAAVAAHLTFVENGLRAIEDEEARARRATLAQRSMHEQETQR